MTSTPLAPIAVVTGASSGIGRFLATEFGDRGFDLVLCAEDPDIHRVSAELAQGGRWTRAVQADLATAAGVEELARAVDEIAVPIDVLAINAGVGHAGPFARTSLAGDLEVIAVNVTSAVHLTKLLLPPMIAHGSGRILFTSSVAATMPGPFYATYAASKAFVQSFAQALRYELKDTGVSVTALMPGPTDTTFFDRAGMQDTPVDDQDKDDPAGVARQAVDALVAGDDHVVAGSVRHRVQSVAARLMPETLAASAHARMTVPAGTAPDNRAAGPAVDRDAGSGGVAGEPVGNC
ncbi:SDR family NAD(P)-dependent oxidoreductase [Nakamurella sp.]|uniref:SDR family NAD(P)-dependent oxidoreductase n=1 Tax=Nakamurella sp. TaxID=1869182 RepID=UPI003B3A6684